MDRLRGPCRRRGSRPARRSWGPRYAGRGRGDPRRAAVFYGRRVTSAVRLVDLRETPLDVGEVVAALDDEAAGGLTLFVGRVRDHDGGKDVAGLDYSAHPTALAKLRE